MIPAKGCVSCGFINSCDNASCKKCGNKLGREWGDNGHFSVGFCEICNRNIGVSGNVCATCGDEVPWRYEDFFNGRVKNHKNKSSENSTDSSSTTKKKKGWW